MKIDQSQFDEAAERGYRRAVDAAAAQGKVATLNDCRDAAEREVLLALSRDPLAVDLRREYASRVTARTDSRITDFGKKLLDAYAEGVRPLGDLLDAVIIPLGEGGRCLFSDLDLVRLLAARALRDRNLFAVQAENERYVTKIHAPIEAVLITRNCNIRTALQNGWL